jgi:outer membrane protein assembly factor BamB
MKQFARPVVNVVVLLGVVCGVGAAEPTAYRGSDGSGVYADAKPPVSGDEATKKNVMWKSPVPNWGFSQPVVAGGKVFVTCEAGWPANQAFPLLVCYDAATGKELWRRSLDHLPAVIPGEAKRREVSATWSGIVGRFAAYFEARNLAVGDREAGVALATKAGLKVGEPSPSNKSGIGSPKGEVLKTMGELKAYGLNLDNWWSDEHGIRCVGNAHATPCTDGTNVYAATGMHGYFCFDLDGTAKWTRFEPGEWWFNTYGGNDYCKNARSPLLYRGLFISDLAGRVRAFDVKTGATKWSHQIGKGHQCIVSPAVITVAGRDVLLCGGPGAAMSAFSLPDGAPVPVENWKITGGIMLVKHDERDVVFFSGNGDHTHWGGENGNAREHQGPACVRFSIKDGKLAAEYLWGGFQGKHVGGNGTIGIVYHAGRLYHQNGFILDAKTGTLVAGVNDRKGASRAVPETRSMLAVAGGHVYGLDGGVPAEGDGSRPPGPPVGILQVYTVDGKKVAESRLVNAVVEGEKQKQIAANHKYDSGWGFSYSAPFTVAGHRLYVRSNDYLWCLGEQ